MSEDGAKELRNYANYLLYRQKLHSTE
jgi:hypothetical protein